MPRLFLIGFALVFALETSSSSSEAPRPLGESAESVVRGNTAFALNFYAKLRQGSNDNLFFSPFSVSSALAMTVAGARGETESQMLKALQLNRAQAELHPIFGALRRSLISPQGNRKGYRLNVADRLWGQQGFPFRQAFLTLTRTHYDAELAPLDFTRQPEIARRTINNWVAEKTEGKIRDLLTNTLDPSTRLVLTDAIYFLGEWPEPFAKHATRDEPFHVSGQQDRLVPMMHRTHEYRAGARDGIKILEMDYGAGDTSMVILLPDDVAGLAKLEEQLSPANLERWLGLLEEQEVVVSFPRFQLSTHIDLIPPLRDLGITEAFAREQADFSGIDGRKDLFISAAIHQAFVDVNEKGTEAAAATGIAIAAKAEAPTASPMVFQADHPFFFLIRDRRSGTLLFMGRLTNPKR